LKGTILRIIEKARLSAEVNPAMAGIFRNPRLAVIDAATTSSIWREEFVSGVIRALYATSATVITMMLDGLTSRYRPRTLGPASGNDRSLL
jgi:hypothetical protein